MVIISLLSLIAAVMATATLSGRFGNWNATLLAARRLFIALIAW